MIKCPACGFENAETSKFCNECGYSFTGGQTGQLNPDTVLENRYIIIKALGRGGMGAVYLALDTRLNNIPVAIKEMSTRAVGGDLQAAIGSFKKEASLLINLRHHALPRINDFFSRGEDRWYLVMDYIEGQTLREIANSRGPIPEAEVLDWGCQLCEILDYLHKQNPPVIFRDLKPANIMLTPDGHIKLIDFGIARHFRAGSSSDTAAYGSSGFAPPEQYGENQTDPRSDIYALGATMHYLLTGQDPQKNPFIFENPSKTVKVSDRLETAVMKAIALKAADRHQDAAQMLHTLSQINLPASKAVPKEIREPKAATITGSDSRTTTLQADISPAGTNEQPVTAAIVSGTARLSMADSKTVPGIAGKISDRSKGTPGKTAKAAGRPTPLANRVFKIAALTAALLIILIIVPPIYGNIKYNSQPKLELVKQGDKWGFNNPDGEDIKARFDNPPAFCEGLAAVEVDGKWGFIDTSGDYIVKPQYDEVRYYISGRAAINADGRWGFIDKSGNPQ